MQLLSFTSLCQSVDEKEKEPQNQENRISEEETNMATRESRMSLDSGFSDEKQIRKQKHKRTRNKSKQRRKLCKDDIGKPLLESYSHMAHIGSGGDCFGEISPDMTKIAISENSAKFSDCEGATLNHTNSDSANSDVDSVRLRPAHSHLTSKMRQSVMSWNMNFEFGNVDILESVLAVMDQLKDEKPELESPNEEEEIFDFQKSPTPPATPPPSAMTNRSSPATTINEEPIYDQVPCEATAIIQRTETIYERIPNQNPPPNNNSQTNNTIARPKFRPPPPVPEPEEDVIYDFIGSSPGSVAKFQYHL
ncbi:Oidioi.mRNA.OKI2018_I69.chr2.g4295.t1.cds [Oikopleura dioica]|uniref:Oidioi.mRNA.OKI2018_I69.chr2.g4295.t1.cds n=1 Tax=Oikopleura dioica TaxID=34765 RepID=A0ABN7T5Y8_OIKDI|nr:Oidioi.mRNA.OKI2018_I69.chr2.g4295.t1.cds [Oikopleura dioica]